MEWPFRRGRVVERTCLECGATWTLKAALAHRKSPGPRQRGFSAADLRYAERNVMSNAATEQLMAQARHNAAEADKDIELLRQLRTCPKCGTSDRYTEMRVRDSGRRSAPTSLPDQRA